jgi:hypothetical protein
MENNMKLSEAMRLGAMMTTQAFGQIETEDGTCALGAAIQAAGCKSCRVTNLSQGLRTRPISPDAVAMELISIPNEWYALLKHDTACPACGLVQATSIQIPHLNDDHRWTRERIADWLEPFEEIGEEPCLTIVPSLEPVSQP